MIWFILLMVGMASVEAPKLYSSKSWRELAAFCAAWILATAYGILIIADVGIPRPSEIIIAIFERLF